MLIGAVLTMVAVPAILFPLAIERAREVEELADPTRSEDVQGEVVDVTYTKPYKGRSREFVHIALTDGTEVSFKCLRGVCLPLGESVTVTRHLAHPDVFYATSNDTGETTWKLARNKGFWTAQAWTVVAPIPLLVVLLIIWREHRLRARIREIRSNAYRVFHPDGRTGPVLNRAAPGRRAGRRSR